MAVSGVERAGAVPVRAETAAVAPGREQGFEAQLLAFDPRQIMFREAIRMFAAHVRSAEVVEARAGLPKGSTPNPESVARLNGQRNQFDGAGDALKHVYLSAIMAYSNPLTAGPLQIKELIQMFDGNAHGRSALDNFRASEMDRHNNDVGFAIGHAARLRGLEGTAARDFIVNRVIQAMERGSSLSDNGLAWMNPSAPYWIFNHGRGSLDQASPNWRQNFRSAVNETWRF